MRRLLQTGKFLNRYVFPDGRLTTLSTVTRHAEYAGFETRDIENLREHYARTRRSWVRRLESREADAIPVAGEHTFRIWRLYMAAAARAFETCNISVAQILLAKPDASGGCCLPQTRDDIYRIDAGAPVPFRPDTFEPNSELVPTWNG